MRSALSPRYCVLIFSLAVVARVASAASNTEGTWLYPDPNTTPTFNYLDTLNASWTSDFTTPWLHLWCGIINGNSSSPVLGELYNKTAPATGSLDIALNYALEPFSCHFELSRQPAVGLGGPFAMSGNFNVAIQSDAKPVTWTQNTQASSSSSSSSSTAANTTSTPESTVSPTPSPSNSNSNSNSTAETQPTTTTSSSSSGLSPGAKAGIGLGVALGVLALIAAAAAAFFSLRRRRRLRRGGEGGRSAPWGSRGGGGDRLDYKSELDAQDYKHARSEMPGESGEPVVHEKDSAPVAQTMMGELEAPR